jgi:hypothetical protein
MSLDLQFNSLKLTNAISVSSNNSVECRVPLTSEELKGVATVNAVTYLLGYETLNGEIRYNGRAIFTVLYKSEGELKKYEAGVDYSFRFAFEKARENSDLSCSVAIENTAITELNGIVSVSGIILFKGEILECKEVEYFEKDKNLFLKNQEIECARDISKFSKETKIEEEFETSELIGSVLLHTEKVVIKGCECGENKVIVDGEVEVNMLIVPLGKNQPSLVVKKIPYRVEVEKDGISPNDFATCYAQNKGSSIKVYVDESKNKSSISIEVNLLVFGKIYERLSFYPCEDAYSLNKEIYLEKEKITLDKFNGFKCIDFKVESEISLNEDKNSRLISLLSDKIEEINFSGVELSGAVSFDLLCKGEEFEVQSVIVPINYTLPLLGNQAWNLKATLTEVSLSEINSKYFVSFTVNVCYLDMTRFDSYIITKVTEGEDKPVNDSAISVYIPKPNDSLWEISKELGVTEEEILKINKDLTFPLSGEERIVVYREVDIKE